MQLSNQEAERLVREGLAALQRGEASDARSRFETVAHTGRANAQVWLLLATACRAEKDLVAEEEAVDRLLAQEPRLVRAHIMKGDCRAQAGDERAALGFYESAQLLASTQRISDDLATELQRSNSWVARFKTRTDRQREATLAARGFPPEDRTHRFQMSLDILTGRRQIFVQEPTGYYFPELPQIQFYNPADFEWVSEVESFASDIQDEIRAWLAGGLEGFRPYLQRDPNQARVDDNRLLDSSDWSALFLCENGKVFEEAVERCPKTWEAVQAAPLPRISNSPTVMFSLLRPGARIAPHTGIHNARLICHLPLIVPPGCGFRVGNEVREWEEGKLLVFDDSIEHEAWNNSNQDRVVLIFDIWRPELSERERQEVAAVLQGPALD